MRARQKVAAFNSPLVQYGLGLPLFVLGALGRVYPMICLRKKSTTTTLGEVEKLVDSGPYAWVRHPQYTCVKPMFQPLNHA